MHGASSRFVLHSLQRNRRLVFARGRGSRLWDVEGREYLDAVSGTNGPAAVGHAHPAVAAAVAEQMATLPSTFIVHDSVPVVRFAERLAALAPEGLSRTFLCPGGGEAVEAAVKLATLVTGRPGVVSLEGAYHGMSLGTMSLGGLPALSDWFPDGTRWPHFVQVPSPSGPAAGAAPPDGSGPALAALDRALELGRVAAVILELVQGPGGHVELPGDYCLGVERMCRERGALLIVDEVQTGLGRCGSFWATDLYGLRPDMIVIGKAFGGGVPFGGFIARDELVSAEVERAPWHILTFMNQPLQAAAGLAVLDVVEGERLVERARVLGAAARQTLGALVDRYRVVADVRGPGLFLGVELVTRGNGAPATEACAEAWEHALDLGLLTWFGGPGGNVLKVKPPLTTPDDDFVEMMGLIEEVVAWVERRVSGRRPSRKEGQTRPGAA